VHGSDDLGFRQPLHVGVKLIHQLGDAFEPSRRLVGGDLDVILLVVAGHVNPLSPVRKNLNCRMSLAV
jgi:hypothetical protein